MQFPSNLQHLFNRANANAVAAAASAGVGGGENGNASSSSSASEHNKDGGDLKEGSPSPKEAAGGPSASKRKKTASGSGGSTSSKDGSLSANMPPLVGCNGPDGPDKMGPALADKLGPLSIDHIEQMKEGLMPIPPGLLPSGPSPGELDDILQIRSVLCFSYFLPIKEAL